MYICIILLACGIFNYAIALTETLNIYNVPIFQQKIEDDYFDQTSSIEKIYIHQYVSSIAPAVNYQLSPLISYVVDDDSVHFTAQDGVLYNKDKTCLLAYPGAKTDALYAVPDSVVTIAPSAFSGNPFIEKVYLGKQVQYISDNAFYHCDKLTTISTISST